VSDPEKQEHLPHGAGLTPVGALSVWLSRLPVFKQLSQGGTVRLPKVNPLFTLIVVVALVAGAVIGVRTLTADDHRCRDINRSFDIIATPPPPILTEIPDPLRTTNAAVGLIMKLEETNKQWYSLARLTMDEQAQFMKASLETYWISWVANKRNQTLLEEGC
jgi:hypothetical protein